MKNLNLFSIFIMLLLAACSHNKQSANDLVTVDVTKTPTSQKELILQDFMDVEYIPLETNDEFITQGDLLAVGSRYLFVKNWTNDGDIFLFDRSTGKGLGKINHKGQGPKEYTFISGVVWDEDHNELFINCTQTKTIQVYDLSGNYKRSIKHAGDAQYLNIYNFDKKNLICYDASVYQKNGQTKDCPSFHSIISKQDRKSVV